MSEKTDALIEKIAADLIEIKESIRRIHAKLDETAEKATENNVAIRFLKEDISKNEKKIGEEIAKVDEKILFHKKEAIETAQRCAMLKFYTAISTSAIALVIALITMFLKTKI